MNMKDKLLLVDGHNLLFQMFFGMPNQIVNKDGKAIQGVIGFVGALNKIIQQTGPTHVVVVFDGEHENPRTELLAEYKDNRVDYSQVSEEENPFTQLPDVYRALDYMDIKHCETVDCEADDVIASYVLRFANRQMEIVISSWDSDYFQLIRENVNVLRYRGKCTTICDMAYLEEKFDISPEGYADFKALVGDSADNIKGARGIGPKTASALLGQYKSLEGILENVTAIEKKKVREVLQEDQERLRMNYKIIKLDDRATLPFELADLLYQKAEYKTTEVLQGIGLM